MKIWGVIVCIFLICVILCSPVLAISKSDLIAYYRSTPESPASGDYDPAKDAESQAYYPHQGNLPFPTWLFPRSSDDSSYSARKQSIIFSLTPAHRWNDVPVGKPNIYLYNDRDLTAQVRLAPESAITISEPIYQPGKGWQAEIRNGSLNGEGDFLFYEGVVPDSGWQKEEGYVIRAAFREQDMTSMLGQYGYNDKETREFIEYWANHLADHADFVFYPQETNAVDRVMPLYIKPKPDNVMRIWFLAEPLGSAPAPVTHPEKIVREGFYVVEWGVMIQNEYWMRSPPSFAEVKI